MGAAMGSMGGGGGGGGVSTQSSTRTDATSGSRTGPTTFGNVSIGVPSAQSNLTLYIVIGAAILFLLTYVKRL